MLAILHIVFICFAVLGLLLTMESIIKALTPPLPYFLTVVLPEGISRRECEHQLNKAMPYTDFLGYNIVEEGQGEKL